MLLYYHNIYQIMLLTKCLVGHAMLSHSHSNSVVAWIETTLIVKCPLAKVGVPTWVLHSHSLAACIYCHMIWDAIAKAQGTLRLRDTICLLIWWIKIIRMQKGNPTRLQPKSSPIQSFHKCFVVTVTYFTWVSSKNNINTVHRTRIIINRKHGRELTQRPFIFQTALLPVCWYIPGVGTPWH